MITTTQHITTTLAADGQLTLAIEDVALPAPLPGQVVLQVEAAPINPSDLALMFGPADVAGATYAPGRLIAHMPAASLPSLQARIGQSLPIGNEGAGLVIAAGSDPAAQALIGRRVAVFAGGMYARHRVVEAKDCLPLPDGTPARDGAASFVNPMTALAFVECLHAEGHKALVHTAAASNLGQMLHRICAADGIGLVNVVRKPEQAALLRGMGAQYVVDSSSPEFEANLVAAIRATGATMAFDAIGGGPQLGQILHAMEQVANSGAAYSRYGSNTRKRGYIYGSLDTSPTVLHRTFGFVWDVSGWLLLPMMDRLGDQARQRMAARVAAELTTTFASQYKAEVSLEGALSREAVLDYNARATGSKYLILPNA